MTDASPPIAETLEVSLLRGGVELIEEASAGWEVLCDQGDPALAFLRPALVSAYVRAFASDATVVLLIATRGGRLTAVLPLVERAIGFGPLRVRWLHSAGNVHFPRFDVVIGSEDADLIAERFWGLLRAQSNWDVIQIDGTPLDGVASRMRLLAAQDGSATHVHHPGETPYVTIPPAMDLDELHARQNKKLRSTLRRGRTRLEERGPVRLVHVRGADSDGDIADWLDKFCQLEHRSWKGEAGTSILAQEATQAFYQTLARDPKLREHFTCFALMCGDEIASSDIGLHVGTTYFSMKIAMDSAFRDCSPGQLITLYAMHALARQGCREMDLGGRVEPYKVLWTSQTRPFGAVFVFQPGLAGRLQHALLFRGGAWLKQRMGSAPLPPAVRRFFE